MDYQIKIQKITKGYFVKYDKLVICDNSGKALDRLQGIGQGIKKAKWYDFLSFNVTKVVIDHQKHYLNKKSLHQFFIRNATHLLFDRYSLLVHRAIRLGFQSAVHFIPKNGKKRAQVAGELLLRCALGLKAESPILFTAHNPTAFKESFKNALHWEHFFVHVWRGESKQK